MQGHRPKLGSSADGPGSNNGALAVHQTPNHTRRSHLQPRLLHRVEFIEASLESCPSLWFSLPFEMSWSSLHWSPRFSWSFHLRLDRSALGGVMWQCQSCRAVAGCERKLERAGLRRLWPQGSLEDSVGESGSLQRFVLLNCTSGHRL